MQKWQSCQAKMAAVPQRASDVTHSLSLSKVKALADFRPVGCCVLCIVTSFYYTEKSVKRQRDMRNLPVVVFLYHVGFITFH